MHPNGKRSVDINNWQKQKAFLSRGARADTAVRPYAEDLLIEDVGNSNMDEVL